MLADVGTSDLFELIMKSGLLGAAALNQRRADADASDPPQSTEMLLRQLVQDGLLTPFQAKHLLHGRHKGFFLGDKYKLLAHVGSGGMGQVYLCEQLLLHRLVAVKVLQQAAQSDSGGAVERFFREARAVAQLDHPNIVRVFDLERNASNPFMVMEYVDGTNLHALVSERGPVSIERGLNFVLQAARGLKHAHGAGLIHRDIKPGNLLLDRTGTVKLLDLGLARFFTDNAKNNNLTAKYDENNIIGTADYIAPEQTQDSSKVDGRADIYSLGGTLYYLLAGRAPFEGGNIAQKLLWHQLRDPDPISAFRNDVPADVDAFVKRMMAKKPEDRFQSPQEVIEALAPWEAADVLPPKPEEMPKLKASSYRLGLTAGHTGEKSEGPTTPRAMSRDDDTPHAAPSTEILRAPQSTGPETTPAHSPRRSPKLVAPNAKRRILGPASMPMSASIAIPEAEDTPSPRRLRKPLFALLGGLAIAAVAAAILAIVFFPGLPAVATVTPTQTESTKSIPIAPDMQLAGGGSTFVEKMIRLWASEYEPGSGTAIRYEGVGSGKGVQGMLEKKYAFGCTDAFLSDTELLAAKEKGADVVHIPLVMGAVVPTYNLPELKEPIRFTGSVLADIYLGKITRWNHQSIQITNPTIALPDRPITVIHRSEKSGTTHIWTEYLGKKSAAWRESMGPVKTEYAKWPAGQGAPKNEGVAELVTQKLGAIGYVELAFALEKNLSVGLVQNAATQYIAPSLDSVTAAAAALKSVPFDMRYTLTDAEGDKSYPIAGSAWAVFDLNHPDAATRRATVEFVWWATHEGQKSASKLRYSPLPAELVGLVEAKLRPLRDGK